MKNIIVWLFIFALFALTSSYFWLFKAISALKTELPQKAEAISIVDYDKLKKLEQLKHLGTPIDIQTLHFGRDNPFAPY